MFFDFLEGLYYVFTALTIMAVVIFLRIVIYAVRRRYSFSQFAEEGGTTRWDFFGKIPTIFYVTSVITTALINPWTLELFRYYLNNHTLETLPNEPYYEYSIRGAWFVIILLSIEFLFVCFVLYVRSKYRYKRKH